MAVEERTRTEIWQGMWDAKRLARYYQVTQQRNQRMDRIVTAALLTAGSASAATLWDLVPDWGQGLLALAVAALTIWAAISRYAAKAVTAHSISQQCNDLVIEWRSLMADVDTSRLDDLEARQSLDRLDDKMGHVTARSGDAGLTYDEQLNEQTAKDAAEEMKISYA